MPTRRLPDALMYLGSLFDKRISWGWLRATLGRTYRLDNSKAQRELGLRYLPLEQTLLDACRSMVELGVGRPRQRRT